MPKSKPPYPPELRRQLVAMVRAGRSPQDLAREYEPSAQSIANWVLQADRDEGLRSDGLTTDERAELSRADWSKLELRQRSPPDSAIRTAKPLPAIVERGARTTRPNDDIGLIAVRTERHGVSRERISSALLTRPRRCHRLP